MALQWVLWVSQQTSHRLFGCMPSEALDVTGDPSCFQILWADVALPSVPCWLWGKCWAKCCSNLAMKRQAPGSAWEKWWLSGKNPFDFLFSASGLKSCCLLRDPTTCFFYVWYLNLKAMGISGPHFEPVAEFPKNLMNVQLCHMHKFHSMLLISLVSACPLYYLVHSFLIFFIYQMFVEEWKKKTAGEIEFVFWSALSTMPDRE